MRGGARCGRGATTRAGRRSSRARPAATERIPGRSRPPPGRGTASEGAALFARHCAACHGKDARGGSAEELAGATRPLNTPAADKTVGSYWPYATTLFDFIRRAKPMAAPGTLNADEVYALSAWLLHINGVIAADAVMDARTLPAVRMPNRDGFIRIEAN
ncbi:cytochrome c [Methyloversatilis sp.]|uniref:c-type cytochrome n=1 Tax=Methyloversatilis sp. TaxID=2569862 RepID=UPI0034583409